MQTDWIDRRRTRQVLTLGCITATLLCIFPPETPFFEGWSRQSVPIAVAFLGLGMFFLAINRIRLMFVCLGCSGSISFWLLETQGLQAPAEAGISVALYDGRSGVPAGFGREESSGLQVVLGLPPDTLPPQSDSCLDYRLPDGGSARLAVHAVHGALECRNLPNLGVLLRFSDRNTGRNWWLLLRDAPPASTPASGFIGRIMEGAYLEGGLLRAPLRDGAYLTTVPTGRSGDREPAMVYLRLQGSVQCSALDTLRSADAGYMGLRATLHASSM